MLDHIRSKQEADELIDLFKEKIKHLDTKKNTFELKDGKSALKQFATEYTIEGKVGYDAKSFLREAKPLVVDLLEKKLMIKVKMGLQSMMEKIDIKTGETKFARPAFWSEIEVNLEATDRDELYENMADLIKEKKTRFERAEETGWKFHSIIKLEIHTVKYNPLRGDSWIDLPDELKTKRAINMKNTDNQCFKWAVTRALNPTGKHDERIDEKLREKAEELNWNEIDFPVSWEGIKKFERLNKSISVNVYGWSLKKYIKPLRIN